VDSDSHVACDVTPPSSTEDLDPSDLDFSASYLQIQQKLYMYGKPITGKINVPIFGTEYQ